MTKKTRRFVFWIFFVFFIIANVAVVLFAEGWRLDFNSFKIVKVGGIFIKTSVPDANIYVNNKYAGKTSGILNYTKLIGDLTPKNYNVFIYKDDYYPWDKVIEVKSGLVAELPDVVLFYLEPKKTKIAELPAQTVYSFTVSSDNIIIFGGKNRIAKIYDTDGKFISVKNFKAATSTELISPDKNKKLYAEDKKIFTYYLNDTGKPFYNKAGEKELTATTESPISFLNWLDDSEHILWFEDNALFIDEIDSRGGKRNGLKLYLSIKPPLFWDVQNSDLYYFENNKTKMNLYKINIK